MLSRKPITRSGRGFRVKYPSAKLGRMVECESLLEADVVHLIEFSSVVVSYREQPIRIEYWDEDRMREYFPDFELVLTDGSCIHLEVKPTEALRKPLVAAKLRAIATHYIERGQTFRIVTEQEARREPLRSNLRRLTYLRGRKGVSLPSALRLQQLLGTDACRFEIVQSRLGGEMVWRLLANELLRCDLRLPIVPETLLTIDTGECDATILL